MELEAECNSCINYGQSGQKLNPSDYYSNNTVTFGENMSRFQQYHTPFNTFLQNNNITYPNQQNQFSNNSSSSQASFGNNQQLQQTPCFQNNNPQGFNIFAQQNNSFNNQSQQQQQLQNGVNIFAQNNNNTNQGANIFGNQQNIFSSQNNNNNGNGFNVFANKQQQQPPQNNFVRSGVTLNQLANNLFPQVVENVNKGSFVQNLQQAVVEQDEEGDGDYDPTENEEGVDEGDFEPNNQDEESSSGTSCDDDDPNELNDCLNEVDDKSFNLAEYLRMRDQL